MTLDPRSSAAAGHGAPAAPQPPPVDAAEFARLFAAEAPRVWRLLRHLGVPDPDLDDLCQEVFLVVHQRLGGFRGESQLRTWILGIALRKGLGHQRRRGRREALHLARAPEPPIEPAQAEQLERAELRDRLQRALDALPGGQREVFVLFELQELPMTEVAQLVGAPLQTCYSRLYAARDQLAAALRRLGRDGGSP